MTDQARDEPSPPLTALTPGPDAPEPTELTGPREPLAPPLAESLLALGLIVIVAISFWLFFGPAIRAMWRAMTSQ